MAVALLLLLLLTVLSQKPVFVFCFIRSNGVRLRNRGSNNTGS